ncbi:MAG TPA: O-antigen polymerase [Prolixibacteraceae bacterium]|nr:O-antigen polymerase [Prolixibacteraceae bacterium]
MFLFFTYLFCLTALIAAFKLHDRFDPARYFLLLWGGQVVLIHFIFNQLLHFPGFGLAYLSLTCMVFSLGTFVGQYAGSRVQPSVYKREFLEQRSILLFLFCFVLAMVYMLSGIYANGYKISQLTSFQSLLELNNAASVKRYTTQDQSGIATQLLLTFVYITPLLGGYLLPLLTKKFKFLCYISLLPSLLITLTQAIKAGFITSVGLWGAGVLVSSFAHNQAFFRIKPATLLKITGSLALFFAILFTSMIFRTGKFDKETFAVVGNKFVVWSLGHLPAFDQWYSDNVGTVQPTGGVKTFYGITNFLGIAERKQGVYDVNIPFARTTYGTIPPPDMETNIYTSFRFLIEDFGTLGSLLVLGLMAFVAGFSWMAMKRGNKGFIQQILLISVLFFISWSFVASVWAYTSYIAAMVFIFLALHVLFKKIPDA